MTLRSGRARRPTILIIDNHPMFATALRMALRAEDVDAHQLPMTDPRTILTAARLLPAGVVLLDLTIGFDLATPSDGAELVSELRKQGKQALILFGVQDDRSAAAAVAAGAIGVLPKSISFESLLCTLIHAAAGRPVMSESERREWAVRHRRYRDRQHRVEQRLRRLSPRELEVLRLLADGHRPSSIAERFVVSLPTVRGHVRAVLTKLGVSSQLEAVAVLFEDSRRGWRPEGTGHSGP